GAGVSAAAVVGKRKRKNKAAVANEAERRLLLRSMGAGKMKGTKKAVKTLKGSSKPSSLGRKQKSKKRENTPYLLLRPVSTTRCTLEGTIPTLQGRSRLCVETSTNAAKRTSTAVVHMGHRYSGDYETMKC
ncbi:unnamed protein product, partial [Dibothriocephalus latus]